MRRAAAMLAGVALVATGCAATGNGSIGRWATEPPVGPAVALVSFDNCDAALDRLKDEALRRVGPYGLEGLGGWTTIEDSSGGVAVPRSSAAAPTTTGGAATSSPGSTSTGTGTADVSTTNVQEQGVDEPDLVKTRPDLIVAVVDATVRVVRLGDGGPSLAASLPLPGGYGHQLLLDGDHLLVIANADGGAVPMPGVVDSPLVGAARSGSSSGSGVTPPVPAVPGTLLWSIDLADPAAPRVTGQAQIDGSLVSARSVDGTARLITTSSPTFDFVYPSRPGAEDSALAANRALIESSTIDEWLPNWRRLGSDGSAGTDRPLVDCAALETPNEFSGFGTLAVSTLDLRAGAVEPRDAVAVLGGGETVYASAASLYVTSNRIEAADAPAGTGAATRVYRPATQTTAIHRFDITGTGPATYRASGSVRGHVLDQFSLSEFDDVLRVATTDANGPATGPGAGSASYVTTLGELDGELRPIGVVGDLGRGEQIKAVRFLGPTGYVVTFRQTDPLYTLDLSDPAAPAVVGELHVTGFSSYLHPLGDGLLLGVGQDATTQGRVTGLQVALFDVSDPARPALVHRYTLAGAASDAGQDHHAFLWWAPASLAVLPVAGGATTGSDVSSFVGAIGLTVDASGVSERGRVIHLAADVGGGSTQPGCPPGMGCTIGPSPVPGPESGATILRTVVAGSDVITVSAAGVKTSAIDTLADRAWLPFT